MGDNHKDHAYPQWRLITVYAVVTVLAYIYYFYVVDAHGDVISGLQGVGYISNGAGVGDGFTGRHPHKVDSGYYLVDGWTAVRATIYAAIGYANPHAHINTVIISCLKEAYTGGCKNYSRPIHNPVVNIIGYTVGSALCLGGCI